MIDTLITSSVLILAVMVLRLILGKRVSPQVRYGLWALVAARLALPWISPLWAVFAGMKSRMSVLNAVDAVSYRVVAGSSLEPLVENVVSGRVIRPDQGAALAERAAGIDWQPWIVAVWVTGGLLLGIAMAVVNIRFYRRLVRVRRTYQGPVAEYVKKPVYVAEGLFSPCYFGLGQDEGIYLPEGIVGDADMVRHALAHETGHVRQWDRVWGVLRCVILCYYWINPLVWAACILSRRDCEMACDETAVKLLGESERYAYGRTLVGLVAPRHTEPGILSAATTMTGGKRTVQERIQILAKHPKTTFAGAVCVLAAIIALAGATFTQMSSSTMQMVVSQKAEPAAPQQIQDRPSVSEGTTLKLLKERRWGNYYQLTFERFDPETGEAVPAIMRDDGELRITVYQDAQGTVPIGDGEPAEGYGYEQDTDQSSTFTLDFWNTQQARSWQIAITDGRGEVDYQYVAGDPEQPEVYPFSQEIPGMSDTAVTLTGAEEYDGALCLTFRGSDKTDFGEFYKNNVLLLKMKGEEDLSRLHGPNMVNQNGREIRALYIFDEPGRPLSRVEAIVAGLGGDRETYLTTPLEPALP